MVKRSRTYDERVSHFWSQVAVTDNTDECWIFTGYVDTSGMGYGKAYFDGGSDWAHRIAYRTAVGEIAAGRLVCHSCDNPPCCNPFHLFGGSIDDNNKDMAGKLRSALGEKNGSARLTRDVVLAIRSDIRLGTVIADSHGISRSLVSLIKNGKVWRHIQ